MALRQLTCLWERRPAIDQSDRPSFARQKLNDRGWHDQLNQSRLLKGWQLQSKKDSLYFS